MPEQKKSSIDLRNKYNEVSRYCLRTGEPVVVTRNGRNDLVIMSPLAFEHFEEIEEGQFSSFDEIIEKMEGENVV